MVSGLVARMNASVNVHHTRHLDQHQITGTHPPRQQGQPGAHPQANSRQQIPSSATAPLRESARHVHVRLRVACAAANTRNRFRLGFNYCCSCVLRLSGRSDPQHPGSALFVQRPRRSCPSLAHHICTLKVATAAGHDQGVAVPSLAQRLDGGGLMNHAGIIQQQQ